MRLVAQGIIESQKAGRGHVHRFNRSHVLADAVLTISQARELFIARLREELEEWDPPPLFAAFMVEQAIEIFIVIGHESAGWQRAVAQLTLDAFRWTGKESIVHEVPPDEFEALIAARPDLTTVLPHPGPR